MPANFTSWCTVAQYMWGGTSYCQRLVSLWTSTLTSACLTAKRSYQVIVCMAMPRNCSHLCCSIRNIVMPFEGVMGLRTCIAMVVLLVPLFKATNQTNYTIEAFSSFTQHACLLPSWIADQILWSHYINTHGSLARIYLVISIWSI